MVEVLVIGVEPPCPRCDLVHLWVDEIADAYPGKVRVMNLSFQSVTAQTFGAERGKRVGTAHEVSAATGVLLDDKALSDWTVKRALVMDEEPTRPAELWEPEMDAIIEPCRQAALASDWLMTPIFIINGEVLYHGGVPKKEQVKQWIMAALSATQS